ncbi:hypothetical protein [Streptomyces odontomachi]|uniref:hypothetical protein n=1 Tax=Streptomyces odontomachi TaxID=2944940 RepID=UPI00210E7A62|nr:hypothetical protein [Streptomyces sp. ODS25]
MELTAAHWTYLAGVVVIIGVMVGRKNVVVPAVLATFVTAWVYSGSLIKGLTAIFSASLTAASQLFSIFLIIALITALLGALRALGAEHRMVRPFRGLMRNGTSAFFTIAVVTYCISAFFWPTPAVPLIGAILLPAAIRAGLPPLSSAAVIAIAGQGMALSSDYVIQVAPGLSAKAAGTSTAAVADRAMVLSLITGIVALGLVYLKGRRTFVPLSDDNEERWLASSVAVEGADEVAMAGSGGSRRIIRSTARKAAAGEAAATGTTSGTPAGTAAAASAGDGAPPTATLLGPPPGGADDEQQEAGAAAGRASGGVSGGTAVPRAGGEPVRRSQAFALLVPVAFAGIVVYMLLGKFTDAVPEVPSDDTAGLVGGVAMLLLFAAALSRDGAHGLTTAAEHVVDGLVFAFKAMGVVVPIAGFFFLGNPDFVRTIAGSHGTPPAFLFDLVTKVEHVIPDNGFFMAFAILLIGMVTGLEGSGFAGLPLTGSLAGALGPGAHVDPATLAAVGQMGTIWSGGGVLIAWSSLLAVAGVARVPVQEVVRFCFLPVLAGLAASAALSTLLF